MMLRSQVHDKCKSVRCANSWFKRLQIEVWIMLALIRPTTDLFTGWLVSKQIGNFLNQLLDRHCNLFVLLKDKILSNVDSRWAESR